MCERHNPRKIDECMKLTIENLKQSHKTLSCCCGHGKYPTTIVVEHTPFSAFELVSKLIIPRKKRFYVKDKEGYYFIPETVEYWNRKFESSPNSANVKEAKV